MFSKNIFGILTTFCLIGFLVVGLLGCSEKIINENARSNVTVSFSTKTSGFEMSQLVQTFTLTVEAEDIPDTMVVPLTLEGSFLVGQVDVPVGVDRHFTADAYDIAGTLIYQGVDTSDVIADSTITVNIDLFPVVPLIKVIPRIGTGRISSIGMGESFVADVYAYNVPDVRYIEFDLSYLTSNFLVNFFSVVPGADLPLDSRLSYVGGNFSVTIWLDRPNLAEPLVDTLGNAHLLTFRLNSHSDTMDDYDTVSLEITPVILDRGSPDFTDPFPLGSLYLESSIVELYKVTDS